MVAKYHEKYLREELRDVKELEVSRELVRFPLSSFFSFSLDPTPIPWGSKREDGRPTPGPLHHEGVGLRVLTLPTRECVIG
ncbi:hypothetical protein BaRGS_00008443 [Batillaria attramentaria]|uniref:Uncharacterized protein n=1 Tax=Batillaria attramentaria TaxID=370345 RepID=A0ABD0LLL9_9CAEN